MYLRDKALKFLKIKNVLLVIAGVFFLFAGAYNIISLFVYYSDDIDTAIHAKAMPGSIRWVVNAVMMLLIALFSRKLIGDARFYSSYFEGSLDGRISCKELSKITGKPRFIVYLELSFFRYIYMKKYTFVSIEGKTLIELYSKRTLCECKNCGAPIDKRIYFTGICSYCGSSDLFAKILSGDRFYSISNEVKKGYNKPDFYKSKSLDTKKNLFIAFVIICAAVCVLLAFVIGDDITKYNSKSYLTKTLLDPSNHLYSFELIKKQLMNLIIFSAILLLILLVLGIRRLLKIFFICEADSCASFFSKSEKPFIPTEEIPSIKAKGNKKMRRVRGALRNGYLANCTLEAHDDQMKVALAKKIVKDTCPSCASPIVDPVDENYTCQVCGNRIMGVIEKK
ncbi:MAG: hypothetical protein IKZ90_07120 [Clostridiales bacterium]|nr:hypothetical protein [Clostridiales bacterium]